MYTYIEDVMLEARAQCPDDGGLVENFKTAQVVIWSHSNWLHSNPLLLLDAGLFLPL